MQYGIKKAPVTIGTKSKWNWYCAHWNLISSWLRLKKLTATILIANVWKAPYVAQINGKPDYSQQKFNFLVPSFALSLRWNWYNCDALHWKWKKKQGDSTKTSRPTKKIIVYLLDISELERRSGFHHFRLQWIAFFGHQFIATIVGAAALSQTGAFINKWGAEAAIWSSIVAGDAIVTSIVVSIIIGRRHCWWTIFS